MGILEQLSQRHFSLVRACDMASSETTEPVAKKSPEDLRDELQKVLGRLSDLCPAPRSRALKYFGLYARLRKERFRVKLRKKLVGLVVLILAAWIYRRIGVFYDSVRYDKCLIGTPSIARNTFFRPVEDCSICQDVHEIEKVSNVDPHLFEERYAYSGKPVVVTDAAANWTAMETFSFAFFKELYEGQSAKCQFFPYKTEFHSLQDVFNMSDSRALLQAGTKPWYVGWSNCDQEIGDILRKHYQRPYFLPENAESEKTDWLFMGSHGYGAPMHVDNVKYPSWQAQISGKKLWILEPPRECHYKCDRLEVTVNPGEIIVLDTNMWYHQTLIVSEDISITIGAEYD